MSHYALHLAVRGAARNRAVISLFELHASEEPSMQDEKDKLPSDAENGALKPRDPKEVDDKKSPDRRPDDLATESDPSEQPS